MDPKNPDEKDTKAEGQSISQPAPLVKPGDQANPKDENERFETGDQAAETDQADQVKKPVEEEAFAPAHDAPPPKRQIEVIPGAGPGVVPGQGGSYRKPIKKLFPITLPSGATGKFRKIMLAEEDILADPDQMRDLSGLDEILTACWVETIDPGPYAMYPKGAIRSDGKLNWSKVLQGDRFFFILALRIVTYGDEYEVGAPCPRCTTANKVVVDLREMMREKTYKLSDKDREIFEAGNRFESPDLPDAEVKAFYRLAFGEDERRFNAARKQGTAKRKMAQMVLRSRLLDLEGVPNAQLHRFLSEDMTGTDSNFLRNEFDRHDCGVDSAVNFVCDNCHHEFEEDVPFDQNFLAPQFSRKEREALRAKKKASGTSEITDTSASFLGGNQKNS